MLPSSDHAPCHAARPLHLPPEARLGTLLWPGDQLGGSVRPVCPSGHARLDAELPGGGWPPGSLTELRLPAPGHGEWRLLAPALAHCHQDPTACIGLVDAPHPPLVTALQPLGLDPARLLWLSTRGPNDAAWAVDQLLQSPACTAVLWWPPRGLPSSTLRRLHLLAQRGAALLFVLQADEASAHAPAPGPAPLRLRCSALPHQPGWLAIELLKRRGPPCPQPLRIDTTAGLGAVLVHRLDRPLPASLHPRPPADGRPVTAPALAVPAPVAG